MLEPGVLHLDRDVAAVLRHRAMDLREGRRGDWVLIDGGENLLGALASELLLEALIHLGEGLEGRLVRDDLERLDVGLRDTLIARSSLQGRHELCRLVIDTSV